MAVAPRRGDGQAQDDDAQSSVASSGHLRDLKRLTPALQQRFELGCAVRVGVFRQHPPIGRAPDRSVRSAGSRPTDVLRNLLAIIGHQHLAAWLQKQFDALPLSVIRHAPAPAASNIRVAGENPYRAMLSRLTFTCQGVQLNAL